MNLFDALVVCLAVAASVGGFRLGFVARSSSWLGMAVGVVVGSRLAKPVAARLSGNDTSGTLLAVAAILLATALGGQLLGLLAGNRLRLSVPVGLARSADRRLGAAAGLGGVVLAMWLLLPIISVLRSWPARQAQDSAFANLVAEGLPSPPDALRSLAGLVGPQRWQEMLTGMPVDALPAPPSASGIGSDIEVSATRSIVKISGDACGDNRHGSGFVVEGDLVVTNAHVVAGVPEPRVITPSGSRELPARVVVFDSGRDLSVLKVPGLSAPALALKSTAKGETGAVFGYPGGGELTKSPYKVALEKEVSMPDLYDQNGPTSNRNVLFLAARLQAGDSGSPLVDAEGRAVGVAFAISRKDPNLAFALTVGDVKRVLDLARQRLAARPDLNEPSTGCLPVDPLGTAASVDPIGAGVDPLGTSADPIARGLSLDLPASGASVEQFEQFAPVEQ